MVHDAGPATGRLAAPAPPLPRRARRRLRPFAHPAARGARTASRSSTPARRPTAAGSRGTRWASRTIDDSTLTFELIALDSSLSKAIFRKTSFDGPRDLEGPAGDARAGAPGPPGAARGARRRRPADRHRGRREGGGEPRQRVVPPASAREVRLRRGGRGWDRPPAALEVEHLGLRFTDVHEDPETAGAARALDRLFRDRGLARAQRASRSARLARGMARRHGHEPVPLLPDAGRAQAIDADILKLALDRFGDRRSGRRHGPRGRSGSRS